MDTIFKIDYGDTFYNLAIQIHISAESHLLIGILIVVFESNFGMVTSFYKTYLIRGIHFVN